MLPGSKLEITMPKCGNSADTYALPRESWKSFLVMGVILPAHILIGLGSVLAFLAFGWGVMWGTISSIDWIFYLI